MKYEMNLIERLRTLQLLPAEGNIAMFRVMTKLRNELSLTDAEVKDFEYKVQTIKGDDGREIQQTTWNEKGNQKKEKNISEAAKDIIVERIKKLDGEKKITMDFMPVIDLFMPEEKE